MLALLAELARRAGRSPDADAYHARMTSLVTAVADALSEPLRRSLRATALAAPGRTL
jgi:hypothetical protein